MSESVLVDGTKVPAEPDTERYKAIRALVIISTAAATIFTLQEMAYKAGYQDAKAESEEKE